ncbi:MAG: hypothetical protein M1438_16935 [Deltaproteobacteria bacterium]|nr:hypothetical protein [Deltaproteobacteria bacterium]
MTDYRERFVANIKILGFEELLGRSAEPSPSVRPEEIIEALEVPKPGESTPLVIGKIGDIAESGHRMNVFANRIAITVDPTAAGLVHLLRHVAKIGFRLIGLTPPVFCRGGITKGLVYHGGQVILGPGLDEAYNLAKNVARYPRVVLKHEVIQFGMKAAPPIDAIIKGFVRQDEIDGFYYVNILRVLRMAMSFEKEPLSHILALRDHIAQHLQEEIPHLYGERREQLLWFKRYFDWATERGPAGDLK